MVVAGIEEGDFDVGGGSEVLGGAETGEASADDEDVGHVGEGSHVVGGGLSAPSRER